MAEDSLGDGVVLMLLYGHASFKLYSAPIEFLSSGPATSGDNLPLLKKTAKASKFYEVIVTKCIRFHLKVAQWIERRGTKSNIVGSFLAKANSF
jgi:hypothetical protein